MKGISTFSDGWISKLTSLLRGNSQWTVTTLTDKVTAFTASGAVNPTFSGVTIDRYMYRELTDGGLRVLGEMAKTAGGTNGSGSYQISLPSGYEFDTSVVTFETNNGADGFGRGSIIIRSGIGSGILTFDNGGVGGSLSNVMIVPTSATTFRLGGTFDGVTGSSASGFWGSTFYAASFGDTVTFDGVLPVIKI